jgi:integrase/recombinase XerD
VSKETRTISDLVNAISEEMTRLDYKPTVLKQYHIVWNKLCKHAGVRPTNDFDMEFGMKFLGEAMRAHRQWYDERQFRYEETATLSSQSKRNKAVRS